MKKKTPLKDSLTASDFQKACDALMKANVNDIFVTFGAGETACPAPAQMNWKNPCCKQDKEVENTMNYTYNETEATRKYLTSRVNEIRYTQEADLAKKFNLHAKDRPATYKDLIDAIKNGNYKLDEKKTAQIDAIANEDNGYYYGSVMEGIIWQLPNGPDWDGYRAAEAAMKKARQAALDIVNTADASTALKAVQDFEAWTYTAPTA